MPIKTSFTDVKKTLFLRQFRPDGSLARKRVVKGDIQYDSCFDKNGERWETLITDKKMNTQVLNHAPHKMNILERIIFKLLKPSYTKIVKNKDGYYLHEADTVYFNYKNIPDPIERKLLNEEQKLTGFSNPLINKEEKQARLNLMFK